MFTPRIRRYHALPAYSKGKLYGKIALRRPGMDDGGQLETLYDEWMCGRRAAYWAAEGTRRAEAVEGWKSFLHGA
jgi:hypothetical protein